MQKGDVDKGELYTTASLGDRRGENKDPNARKKKGRKGGRTLDKKGDFRV